MRAVLRDGRLALEMVDGAQISFEALNLEALRGAGEDEMAQIRICEGGASLHWPVLAGAGCADVNHRFAANRF